MRLYSPRGINFQTEEKKKKKEKNKFRSYNPCCFISETQVKNSLFVVVKYLDFT